MSQQEKGDLYRKLKEAGVEFSKQYRNYTTDELRTAANALAEAQPELAVQVGLINPPPGAEPERAAPPPDPIEEVSPEEAAAFFGGQEGFGRVREQLADTGRMPATSQPSPPVMAADPNEMPGQRLNQSVELEPIRTDEAGRVWYQEEVLKPSFAKPRGRRVLQYSDTGTETRTVTDERGFTETFEVAGTKARRPSEVKITLPSYQVGIYKDRRFPFKIHTYSGRQGFDLFEVQNYYGGSELVPETVKKVYVENVLCYDIRTVVRAIQSEFRQLQLQGKVK